MIGKTVSHYKILEKLGSGGMGEVYKAQDTKLKRSVALKFLPSDLTRDPDAKKRFIHEAQAASALQHTNICTIYEINETETGQLYISMEHLRGKTLKDKITEETLSIEEILDIITQAARGLEKAHKKGIVHRDIKPANIMITEDGTIKIVDFGLAKLAGQTKLTKTGSTLGTVAYMSPEQTQGTDIDQRTDIWALGVILYEMLSGVHPFQGDYEQAVVYSILNEDPKPLTDCNPEIPSSIEQVVSKSIEKKSDQRYQTTGELLDDLKSISAGIVPEEIKARLRKAKLRKRKRWILYAMGAVCIIAIATALILISRQAKVIDSIAVLPFKNLTGNAEQEFFVDGVTDELIGQLGQISRLNRVISRTSVMQYKETDKSLQEIARELKVDAIIEGTVFEAGDSVRVRLELIDVLPEEKNLWGVTCKRAKSDVLVLYNDVARAIAVEIRVGLTPAEETHFASAPQINPEAYEAYLKGMSYFYRLNPQDLEVAMHYFESSLDKDPDFALAHTGVALVWCLHQLMGSLPPSETTPLFRASAQKALKLDSTLAEVHYTWAFVKWFDWDWKGAEEAFRRSIAINPSYPDARVQYSNLLGLLLRPEEALVQGQKALELDPFNSLITGLYANTLSIIGRYDEAIVVAQEELRGAPNSLMANQLLWLAHHINGERVEAFEYAKTFFTAMGLAPLVEVMEQRYETGGYFEAIKYTAETMALSAEEHYIQPFWLALLYAVAEEKEKCLDWLEKGYETRDPSMAYIADILFRSMFHEEPRYHDMLQKMNLPIDEKK